MFIHKIGKTMKYFITLETKSCPTLAFINDYFLLVNGDVGAASTVNVEDSLSLGNGEIMNVSFV